MAEALLCARCGQRVVGNGHYYAGRKYCAHCYDELMQELIELDKAKEDLYNYIKTLFGVSECPQEVIYTIDRALGKGKKLKGIRATIWYYYEIQGHAPDNTSSLSRVINDYYEDAKNYINHVNDVKAKNAELDLSDVPTVVVKVDLNNLEKKKKIKYRMEDL